MGKFIILKGSGGHYYFNFIASNGENIFTSEKYYFKKACRQAIEIIKSNAMNFLMYELGTTLSGRYYFRLRTSSGHTLGLSCMFESAEKRNLNVERLKHSSPYAGLIDQTANLEYLPGNMINARSQVQELRL